MLLQLEICYFTFHFSLCKFQESGEWSSVPEQRQQIANFISQNKIDNLVIVAGDAHMVCILRMTIPLILWLCFVLFIIDLLD
jgi:hypothetical protein